MEVITDFIINNYLIFLIISIILVLALIGYLVEINKQGRVVKKEEVLDVPASATKEGDKALQLENISLNEMINKNNKIG